MVDDKNTTECYNENVDLFCIDTLTNYMPTTSWAQGTLASLPQWRLWLKREATSGMWKWFGYTTKPQ